MRILELAHGETLDRNSRRNDSVGGMLRRVLDAADPDGAFVQIIRDAGYFHTAQVDRRLRIRKLAEAFGIRKAEMKRYLLAAGLVNETD